MSDRVVGIVVLVNVDGQLSASGVLTVIVVVVQHPLLLRL